MATITFENGKKVQFSGTPTTKDIDEVAAKMNLGGTAVTRETPKSTLGKVAEFIAPTATKAYGKVKAGEKLTGRDIAGSALEVGSFLLPIGAGARAVGLATKGALSFGQKAGLGAFGGALGGGTYEAGRAIGEEDTTAVDVLGRTARGAAFGGAFGAGIPVGIAGLRALPNGKEAVVRGFGAARRGAEAAGRGATIGARAVGGLAQEGAITVGKRIPEKVGQFVEQRAEKATYLKGKPVHVKEAVEKNIERPIIDFVRSASKPDKTQRVQMLERAKRGVEDISFGNNPQNQPMVLVGQNIVEGPVKYLIGVKDAGRNQTKKVLEKLGGKKQDATAIYNQIVTDIRSAGRQIAEGDKGFYKEVLNDLKLNKRVRVSLTFQEMHELRQKWFRVAKTNQTFTKGGATSPQNYAKRLRALLAQPIDRASKGAYNLAQVKTREALEGLEEFVRLMGHKGNLDDITTRDLRAGEVFLRAFGNAADRPMTVLNKLYQNAQKYGYKGADTPQSTLDQFKFADILEDVYGSSQTRALRGQVGRGVSDVADPLSRSISAAREAAKWSPVSAALRLTRGFLSGTGDDTLRAFENLIRVEGGKKIPSNFGKVKSVADIIEQTRNAAVPLIKAGKEEVKKRTTFGRPKDRAGAPKTPTQLYGAFAGLNLDEEGQVTFRPEYAALGFAGMAAAQSKRGEQVFKGLKVLSTKLLEKFRGMPEEITPQQFNEVINKATKEGIKKADLDLVKEMAKRQGGKINLTQLAKDVQTQLVPLTPAPVKSPRWSNVGEDFIGDGKYGEVVYQSPIKTSAGDVHFQSSKGIPARAGGDAPDIFPNYFSHVRYEDMADGKTRKILETQSDLMQKENFANEISINETYAKKPNMYKAPHIAEDAGTAKRTADLQKLQPYSSNDPLAHLRTFREEVKRAAKDGKDTILIPSGETAMKIEGLGVTQRWTDKDGLQLLTAELKSGKEIRVAGIDGENWIITDILGNGRFKAVPKDVVKDLDPTSKESLALAARWSETFDISGKVDIKHFVYKLNEEHIVREARKMGLHVEGKVKEGKGEYWKIKVTKDRAKMPVEAFGALAIPSASVFGRKREE